MYKSFSCIATNMLITDISQIVVPKIKITAYYLTSNAIKENTFLRAGNRE